MTEYLWKHGVASYSDTILKTNRPLEVGKVMVDLCSGDMYQVVSVTKGEDSDPVENILQTWAVGKCADDVLARYREESEYKHTDDCQPFLDVAFQ